MEGPEAATRAMAGEALVADQQAYLVLVKREVWIQVITSTAVAAADLGALSQR